MTTATPEADIRLDRVSKHFHEVVAVDDLSLDILRGEFFSMLGPSGCGKTTTLRMIAGFEDATAGAIYLGGSDVTNLPPFRRDVNTVFQNYALFPHLTVYDNVAFGPRRKHMSEAEVRASVGACSTWSSCTATTGASPARCPVGSNSVSRWLGP